MTRTTARLSFILMAASLPAAKKHRVIGPASDCLQTRLATLGVTRYSLPVVEMKTHQCNETDRHRQRHTQRQTERQRD